MSHFLWRVSTDHPNAVWLHFSSKVHNSVLQTFKTIARKKGCKLGVLIQKKERFWRADRPKIEAWCLLCPVRMSSFTYRRLRCNASNYTVHQRRISSSNDVSLSHTTRLCILHRAQYLLGPGVWLEIDLVHFRTFHNILLRSHLCMARRWGRCHTNPPQFDYYTGRGWVFCVLLKKHSWVQTDPNLINGLPFSPEMQFAQFVSSSFRCLRKHLGLFVLLKVHPVQPSKLQIETRPWKMLITVVLVTCITTVTECGADSYFKVWTTQTPPWSWIADFGDD